MNTHTQHTHAHAQRKRRRRLVVSCIECHRRKQKCDRGLPCANCKARNKASTCQYEKVAKEVNRGPSTPCGNACPEAEAAPAAAPPSPQVNLGGGAAISSIAESLGYAQSDGTTLGILRRIESSSSGPATAAAAALDAQPAASSPAVRERFKSLIRQLPPRVYLDRLLDLYYDIFGHQYYQAEREVIASQLAEWDALPFRVLQERGPDGLSDDMRSFPALLFQMCATALLAIDSGDAAFDASGEEEDLGAYFAPLKYTASMTLRDLAGDYSESGVAIAGMVGKASLTLTTVVAGFMRASFLKYTARVTEAWHNIAMTIRDAQELGMHRDCLDPAPRDASPESALENEWLIQRRRRCYLVLSQWDINMAALLGRPGSIDWTQQMPTPPVDVVIPPPQTLSPVVPRDPARDPPSPVTCMLWFRDVSEPLGDIKNLERHRQKREEAAGPRGALSSADLAATAAVVDRIHERIMAIDARKPAVFRLEGPDTRWDADPERRRWLPGTRYHFAGLHANTLLLLHRPYVFQRRRCRDEALRAGLMALDMSKRMFEGVSADCWSNYHFFYGSFDALVTIAMIYIFFPHENGELKPAAAQHFQWALERFTAMRERNPLARSVLGILRAIQAKLAGVLGPAAATATPETLPSLAASTSGGSGATPTSSSGSAAAAAAAESKQPAQQEQGPSQLDGADWMADLGSLAPVYPSSDILFNDLSAVDYGAVGQPVGEQVPYFDGVFGDDTVWQLLNQYQPSV